MSTPDKGGRVPDLFVERVFLQEASEEERARVLADPDAAARLRDLPMENARFLVAHPPEDVVHRIEGRARIDAARKATTKRTGLVGGLLLVPLAVAAVSLLVMNGVSTTGPDRTTGPEVTTAKGLSAKLRVYRQTSKGPKRLGNGEVLRSGDRLQLGIVPGEATHAAVFSIDGRGVVTQHFPVGQGSTALGKGELMVPEAYQLDDAPDFERFLLITATHPVPIVEVAAAVQRLAASGDAREGALALPEEGLDQSSFLVRKEAR